MTIYHKITVIGGGAWGTALASMATRAGREVTLWAREDDVVTSINETHENKDFLPGITLPEGLKATSKLADAEGSDVILMVVPAQFVRAVAQDLKSFLKESTPIILCAKGIEQSTGKMMNEVMSEVLPKSPLVVLSGPTFAHEVAKGLPAAVTIASRYQQIAQNVADTLGQTTFRPYLSRDVVGAEVGGAVKNVLAVACGIVAGLELGENARAALITRGMAEMVRFGEARGAKRETMMGLCGLGDLILTCSSTQSRNMSLGMALGQGKSVEQIMMGRKSVAEGYHTASILADIAEQESIDMPIAAAVHKILHQGGDVAKVVEDLMRRPYVSEL
ncbi:NAD(P)H-dependent glycerol-3-phosphate dehydrogenase [Paremcibacter congregatus]|uniref:Glycerol-3-phosphate dehydrogenase [NAD(P)+] n=1 Tax=Paremcibacter congregatus TaxID=2043170 RepID=A0A2G4YPH0_9PROT|nr:NAD(P)H-dependent glycerol-3-phosphate dehydrogenase [Paremcibacter congregatus]PHZ84205.1 glycerol-3-phosphate acyltransferase [Paremcibacter congregatus]QDE29060.1 NAD(P)-dependent glycerol-3-phosphate dehydrogenase [Paremcibacter congregatus]